MEYGNNRNYAIIVVILSVLASTVISLQLKIIYDNRQLKKYLSDDFFQINTEEIENKIEEYSNIDKSISSTKEEYFNNIRK